MRKQAQSYMNNCLVCLVANSSVNTKEGEIQLKEIPKLPMHTVHIDHFDTLIESTSGRKHILVLIDSFTRFTWLLPVETTSSRETIENIIPIFNVFGNPNTLVLDHRISFTSSEFSDFIQKRGIKHRLVAIAGPWANGLVECVNHFLKSSLCKVIDDQLNWTDSLSLIQYTVNNTYSAIKCSPLKLLFGYEKRNQIDSPLLQFLSKLANSTLSTQE